MSDQNTAIPYISEKMWLDLLSRVVDAQPEKLPRRKQRRYPLQGEVGVAFEQEGKQMHWELTLLNVSADGITVKGGSTIEPGTLVHIYINPDGVTMALRGIVVHCTQTLGGYKTGVRLKFEKTMECDSPQFSG